MSSVGVNYSLAKDYSALSTGNRLNSAASDPSGLAIAEQLTAQINGYEQGTENSQDMSNLIKAAEGGLSVMNEGLLRIRELAQQSMNGIYSNSNKEIINFEIQQILEGLSQTVSSTQFNGQNLLDGSFTNKNTASSPDGTGIKVSIPDLSLEALGIKDLDVTGDFDLDVIDAALNAVNNARSALGSTSNRLDYTINSNQVAELNLASARSGYTDTDMAKAASELSKKTLMNDIRYLMQSHEQENEKNKISFLM